MSYSALIERAYTGRVLARALAGLGAITAAALVWAQFRGYDMLDGAFYFLVYQNPADYSDTQTHFYLIGRPVWLLCGQNIVVFRIAAIALVSVACALFWRAWKRLVPLPEAARIYWWPLWLASMAGLTWVPVALTYNSLATLFDLLGLAILLGLPSEVGAAPARRLIRPLMLLPLAGVFYGLYLAKPPAAAALAAGGYVLLCFEPRLNPRLRRALILTGILTAAAAAGIVLAVVTRPSFDAYRRINFNGIAISPVWMQDTLRRYLAEIGRLLPALRGDFIWTIGPLMLACGAAFFGVSAASPARRWPAASLALLLLAAAGAFLGRELWDSSFTAAVSGNAARFYLLLWGSLLPVWIICLLRRRRATATPSGQRISWVVVLFVLPLISSLGSTNTVYVYALHHTVFWAAGLLLVADSVAAAFAAPWFRSGFAALLCAGAAGHIFSGHFLRPYLYQPSLWKQTESIEIGFPATRLKIDPALAAFLSKVRATLDANGYRPGDDAFGFFNLPGVIFAIGAKEPGAPWFFGTWYHNDETDGAKLYPVPVKRRQGAWIITQAEVTHFRPQFQWFQIDFPDGYTKIGQTINPVSGLEVGIWKPRGRP
jgi:hypothetical protein